MLKTLSVGLVGALLPKKLGIKLTLLLLDWAAKKTKCEWDDKVVEILKKSI